MKRIILSAVFSITCVLLMAQPEAGKLFIGGNVGFSASNNKFKDSGTITDESSITGFSLLPMAGYFLSDNFALGLRLGIVSSVSRFPDSDPDKRSTTLFVFQPFARYYFTTGDGGIFAEASAGLGAGKSRVYYDANTVETNETDLSFGIGPGAYYYITPAIALEAQFGLIGFNTHIQKDGDQKYIRNDFDFSFFPSGVTVGLTFKL